MRFITIINVLKFYQSFKMKVLSNQSIMIQYTMLKKLEKFYEISKIIKQ